MSVYLDNLIFLDVRLELIGLYHVIVDRVQDSDVCFWNFWRLQTFDLRPYSKTAVDVDAQVIKIVKIVKCLPVDPLASFCWLPSQHLIFF